MRRTPVGCCALAAMGNAAIAPPQLVFHVLETAVVLQPLQKLPPHFLIDVQIGRDIDVVHLRTGGLHCRHLDIRQPWRRRSDHKDARAGDRGTGDDVWAKGEPHIRFRCWSANFRGFEIGVLRF